MIGTSFMTIGENKVVVMHYSVTAQGTELDSSFGKNPLVFIAGQGFLVPGLEAALMGHSAGERFEVQVEAAQGYGERQDELMQAVPKSAFEGMDVAEGMQFRATTEHGEQSVMVLEVTDDEVIVDGNHPLAGMDLSFDISIEEVRDATEEELAHGHVHGQGGCGGHGHGDDHECCGGHGHSHGDDHECCGGKGHDHGDDHECCGGKGHDDDDHECCGGGNCANH
jgi:FKBP-type peptidyl-prolyl cis-trans isomerase SlyD